MIKFSLSYLAFQLKLKELNVVHFLELCRDIFFCLC